MSRGNGRMTIFLDDTDYRRFVFLLGDVLEELEIECWNYCLMPTHYHAVLRPTKANLSEALRRLNGTYASWWNWRHGRVGHVFQGRFKDQIVQEEGYLLALNRYVARNPVRAKLVDLPEQWAWSSYSATIALKPVPPFLMIDPVLAPFGDGDQHVLQMRYAQHVGADGDDGRPLEDRIRSNERILGDAEFKRSFQIGEHGDNETVASSLVSDQISDGPC
jgi:putative transposase